MGRSGSVLRGGMRRLSAKARWMLVAVAALLVTTSGCRTKDPTALVVAISSEAPPPKEIDALEVEVDRDGSVTFFHQYPLVQGEQDFARLPGTLTLQNDTGEDPGTPLTITVRAQHQGKERVIRRAVLGFVSEKTKLLRVPLRYSCVDFPDSCDEGQTCSGGRCVDAHVDANKLPDYKDELVFGMPGAEGGSGGDPNSCFDQGAGACFADAQPIDLASIDGAPCEIPVPSGAAPGRINFAAHWALSDDPSRLVVLEQDPDEGWTYADASQTTARLASGICQAVRDGRITALVYSTACSTKSPDQEVCATESGGNPGACAADAATCGPVSDGGSEGGADAAAARGDGAASEGGGEEGGSADASGSAADGGGAGAPAVMDPAPAFNTPGEYGCSGCPDSAETMFELDLGAVTSHTFSGAVTGAMGDGKFYVVKSLSPTGSTSDGGVVDAAGADAAGSIDGAGSDGSGASSGPTERIEGPIPTAADGSYSFTAPLFCGDQLVKLVWSNPNGTYVIVYHVITSSCVDADIRVTVTWDALGRDWELHLIKPGGRINDPVTDCTWNTCIGTPPDWGVIGDPTDDPKKDVDNTGAYGPENILLSKPENGRYYVMVEHWGAGDPASSGEVILNIKGQVTTVSIHGLAPQHVWTAATIDWNDGAWTVTTSTSIYDCTADWSGGCRAMLP